MQSCSLPTALHSDYIAHNGRIEQRGNKRTGQMQWQLIVCSAHDVSPKNSILAGRHTGSLPNTYSPLSNIAFATSHRPVRPQKRSHEHRAKNRTSIRGVRHCDPAPSLSSLFSRASLAPRADVTARPGLVVQPHHNPAPPLPGTAPRTHTDPVIKTRKNMHQKRAKMDSKAD